MIMIIVVKKILIIKIQTIKAPIIMIFINQAIIQITKQLKFQKKSPNMIIYMNKIAKIFISQKLKQTTKQILIIQLIIIIIKNFQFIHVIK